MTDLCGPSNALQSFQKHATADRTLQQDRFSSLPSSVEGFRSPPGPDVSAIDAEFEAFETSRPPDPSLIEPVLYNVPPTAALHPGPHHSDWATDFQNLGLGERHDSPIPSSQFRHFAPPQQQASGPWHRDFLAYQGSKQSATTHGKYATYRSEIDSMGQFQAPNVPTYQSPAASSIAFQGKPEESLYLPEEEAFAQAFESAERELNAPDITADTRTALVEEATQPTPYRIGSDRILDGSQETEETSRDKDDSDELAKTAADLLEKVKGDTSKKFQESNFLSLMRQLRDREVKVEGDKIVNIVQPLHPGGEHYPHSPTIGSGDHYDSLSP